MSSKALSITQQFVKKPIRILFREEDLSLCGARQFFVAVEKEEWKFETLIDLYDTISTNYDDEFILIRAKTLLNHLLFIVMEVEELYI